MTYFIVGAAVLIGLLLLTNWIANMPTSRVKKVLAAFVVALLLALGVLFIVTGRYLAGVPLLFFGWRLYSQTRAAFRFYEKMKGSAGQEQKARPSSSAMSREEALNMLGLKEGASAEAIRKAHRELIKKVHPDQGGSAYLASKLNEAKDVLLGK